MVVMDLTGLKVYWKLNDAGTTITNSATAVGSTDSVVGGDITMTVDGSSATGKIDDAFLLNGSSGVSTDNKDEYKFLHDVDAKVTIAFWLKHTSSFSFLWQNGLDLSGNQPGLVITIGGSIQVGVRSTIATTDPFGSQSGYVINNDGTWNHIVITYDLSKTTNSMIFYVNGSVIGTRNREGVNGENSSPKNVPYFNRVTTFPGLGVIGTLDEWSMWNRVLTQNEITALYNGGDGAEIELFVPILKSTNQITVNPRTSNLGFKNRNTQLATKNRNSNHEVKNRQTSTSGKNRESYFTL